MNRYLIITEPAVTGFSTYSPDVPGGIATGAALAVMEREMHAAIEFHLEGLRLEGMPHSEAAFCEVAVAA